MKIKQLFIIESIRPFNGQVIRHTYTCYTEDGKDIYVANIVSKFGEDAITSVKEYELKKVLK